MLTRTHWTCALTVNFNRDTTPARGKQLLKDFSARVDRAMVGSQFSKKPSVERVNAILVPEIGPKREVYHYHGCVLVPQQKQSLFKSAAEQAWKSLVPSGSLCIRPITNAAGWNQYVLKGWNALSMSDFVFFAEFHR